MKKVDIDDLKFYVYTKGFGHDKYVNIFNSSRVKWSIAKYVTMSEKERANLTSDPIMFCYGDLWSRCEWEMIIDSWPNQGNPEKVDTFRLYIEKNPELFMGFVNQVSKASARRYLKQERDRLKGNKV